MLAVGIFDRRRTQIRQRQKVVPTPRTAHPRIPLARQRKRLVGQPAVAVALRRPPLEKGEKREVLPELLGRRHAVLQKPRPETRAGVLVVRLHQIQNAAIVVGHRPLVGFAPEGLAVLGREHAARRRRALVAAVNRLDGQQRIVEQTRSERVVPRLHRRQTRAQLVAHPVLLRLGDHSRQNPPHVGRLVGQISVDLILRNSRRPAAPREERDGGDRRDRSPKPPCAIDR